MKKGKFINLDYILTLRCFTHYISKRQNDKLTFDLQKLIAAKIIVNSEKIGANKATERLMKSYFAKIKEVKNLTQIIIDSITLKIEKKNYIQKFVLKESFKKDYSKNF